MGTGVVGGIELYPIDSKPFGLTYEEWSVTWWKWLLSIPKSKNPTNDLVGTNINESQDDPNVFFLCQTIEGVANVPVRRGTIPRDRSLLIPIINWISVLGEDGTTDLQLIEAAKERMDVVTNLQLMINGVPTRSLHHRRARSPIFNMVLPSDNILGLSRGHKRFVSDGYWVLIKPIMIDSITLSSLASCSSGSTRIAINYELNID